MHSRAAFFGSLSRRSRPNYTLSEWYVGCEARSMALLSPSSDDPLSPDLSHGERRRNLRFPLHCSIFLRDPDASDHWIVTETANVSAVGAFFESDVEFTRDGSVEYVLTFPPEWTRAAAPWGVRFHGNVVRVESHPAAYGVAVRVHKRCYLSAEECNGFRGLGESGSNARTDDRLA